MEFYLFVGRRLTVCKSEKTVVGWWRTVGPRFPTHKDASIQPKNNQITGQQQQQQTNITNHKNQPKKENLACLNVYISGEKFQTSKFHEKTCRVDFAILLKGDKISIASEISSQACVTLGKKHLHIGVKLLW